MIGLLSPILVNSYVLCQQERMNDSVIIFDFSSLQFVTKPLFLYFDKRFLDQYCINTNHCTCNYILLSSREFDQRSIVFCIKYVVET